MDGTSDRRAISVRRQAKLALADWASEDGRRKGLRDQARLARASLRAARYRQRRVTSGADRWISYDHLQELNRELAFEPLSDDDAQRLENEALLHSRDDVLDRKVCMVTDTWVFPASAVRLSIDDLPFRAMGSVLKGGVWCSSAIREYYDCFAIDRRLKGMLLSRRAFGVDDDGAGFVWVSADALRCLQVLEKRIRNASSPIVDAKPPKFAIADGFVGGVFPEMADATCVETQAIGLAQIRGVVKVVYGGPGNVLNSHLLCWDNRDATIASRVPCAVTRDRFQLILAGPMTPAQDLLLARRHECNGARVRCMHDLLRRINPLYATVTSDESVLGRSIDPSAITTRLRGDDETELLVSNARARQSTVARAQTDEVTGERRECTVVESQTVLLETTADRDEQTRLARAYANVTSVSDTFVARRSTAILQSTDPFYMERLFPHLLTFGVGGFSTSRRHRYSPRAIVLHYLNVSSNRFAEDSMYKLVMFDYLSTKRVKTGVFLRVGQDPALATTVMRVTPSQLMDAMRRRADQRAAWKEGKTVPLAPTTSAASTLLRSINAAASKMWGSNEERESMTRKVDSMTIRYGAPSVFWTLTPNPDNSLVCAFWTGRDLPGGRPESLSRCGELNMPCASDMSRLIMGNTTVQAQYYKLCCRLLIDVLFGWDMVANKPKAQRGIFGFVETLVYALEQQGRLFVHHHGVAWIAGLPKTQSDWERLLASESLRATFEEYCASIFAAELPVYNTVQTIQCPSDGCLGQLEPSPIPTKFRHVLKSSVPAPVVACCAVCGKEFTEPALVLSIIERQWEELDDENKAVSTETAVQAIRRKFAGLSRHAATARVQLSRLLLKDQVHSWTHSRSCIKGRSGTKCRYKFYRKLEPRTELNRKNEIVFRRRIGNQWLNPFVATWRRVLHFNMDARILWSGQSLQATRYALQYAIKRQTVLDNVAIVDMAFKRRVTRETEQQSTEYAKGIGRLLSLAYSSSGVMEIGGPLATVILHEGEAVTFGCTFERLVLLEGLNLMNRVVVEAAVVSRNREMFTETSISRYINRPPCLEEFSWYGYCSWIRRDGALPSRTGNRCVTGSFSNSQLREHLQVHQCRYLDYPSVPEIIGPRLPDGTRLGDEDYEEQTELYYRMAALLYRPFRDVATFLGADSSARGHFERWMPFSHEKVARSLERHQQHYICLKHAQEYRERDRNTSDDDSDDDDVCVDDDILPCFADRRAEDSRRPVHYEPVSAALYSTDEGLSIEPESEPRALDEDNSPLAQLLLGSIESSLLPPDNSFGLTVTTRAITRAQVRKFQACDPDVDHASPLSSVVSEPSATTVIALERYEQVIRDVSYDRTRRPLSQLQPYASIHDVSSMYNLNHLQHVAFSLIAVPLLRKIVGGVDSPAEHRLFDDTPIIVTGAGGTGKSQIVAAVRALATSWCQSRAVTAVASTGIAAASLQGTTMHSSVGLGINATKLPKHITSPTDALLKQWAPVHCVVADEVSMIDLGFFGLWEESLRYAKDSLDEDYGGLLVVLMFDHCQLRTVKGMPMYQVKIGDAPLSPAQDRGYLLYRKITKAVYLTENMRFADDPEWGSWLASARLGQWTGDCRSYVTSLSSPRADRPNPTAGVQHTISTDNQTRCAVNEVAVKSAVRHFGVGRKVYVIPAQLSRRPIPSEVAVIRLLPDNKTGHIPLFLHVYIGMPVRVKANQCVPKGVANGASATVHHIDWDPATTFSLQHDDTWLASLQPRNFFVDVTKSTTTTRFPGLPPSWPASVMPIHLASASISIEGSSISIKGYPVVPAFGTTVHGVQGETLDAAAVTHLRPAHVRRVDTHALYVALSRIRTRFGLHWIGAVPDPGDYEFFRPAPAVLLEDGRLKRLSATVLANFVQAFRNASSQLS